MERRGEESPGTDHASQHEWHQHRLIVRLRKDGHGSKADHQDDDRADQDAAEGEASALQHSHADGADRGGQHGGAKNGRHVGGLHVIGAEDYGLAEGGKTDDPGIHEGTGEEEPPELGVEPSRFLQATDALREP